MLDRGENVAVRSSLAAAAAVEGRNEAIICWCTDEDGCGRRRGEGQVKLAPQASSAKLQSMGGELTGRRSCWLDWDLAGWCLRRGAAFDPTIGALIGQPETTVLRNNILASRMIGDLAFSRSPSQLDLNSSIPSIVADDDDTSLHSTRADSFLYRIRNRAKAAITPLPK